MNVEITIRQRQSKDGHPFSEIHYVVDDGRRFLTRVPYPVPNSRHQIELERQAFLRRQRAD